MAAPVCNLPNQAPAAGDGSAPDLPSIPPATDPASTQAAVNAMRNYLMNGNGAGAGGNNSTNSSQQQKNKKRGQFVETHRDVKTVKVVNPDDHDQYVKVKQITRLVFTNKATGEQWEWKQGADINANSS